MNTEEQLLLGFLGLLAVAGIVVLIVLLVKKNRPGPGPGPRSCCTGDSQYNCGFYKNKNDCNEAGPTDVPGGCKWTCPTPGPATVPACNVSGGNGVCTSGITPQGKRMCVGGDQLCGIGLKDHQAVHKDEDTCDSLSKYLPQMIKCNDGYQAYIDGDGTSNQGNCLFKCKKSNSENLTCGSSCDPKDKYSCGAARGGCTECAAGGSESGYGCMPPSK